MEEQGLCAPVILRQENSDILFSRLQMIFADNFNSLVKWNIIKLFHSLCCNFNVITEQYICMCIKNKIPVHYSVQNIVRIDNRIILLFYITTKHVLCTGASTVQLLLTVVLVNQY